MASTITTTRKTSADHARAAREKMKEALAMAKKADALMREAARDELRAAEMKAKEKATALAAKEKAKAMKPVKPAGVIVTCDGKEHPLTPAAKKAIDAYCGSKRHGEFSADSAAAQKIVDHVPQPTTPTAFRHDANEVIVIRPKGRKTEMVFVLELTKLVWMTRNVVDSPIKIAA